MPYSDDKKPEPTYTVVVKVVEVVEAFSTGQGTAMKSWPRTTEEVLGVTVRGANEVEAVERAIGMLETHKAVL